MKIEVLDQDRYIVQIPNDDEPVTILVRASADATARLGPAAVSDTRVVEATIDYLVARQGAEDLPQELDIEDVFSAYDDFEGELRRRLQ